MHRGNNSQKSADEIWVNFLESAGRFLLWAGALGTIAGAGFLLYYIFTFGSAGAAGETAALNTIEGIKKFLLPSVIALSLGSSITFWGEEVLGVIQLIGAAIMGVAPKFLVSDSGNQVQARAAAELQTPALVLGLTGLVVIVFEVVNRMKDSMKVGARSDKMKFGKGVQQENVQNVFMGKCWQLPYCKKFVRERCPIFVAQTTCWREGTGCMCDEMVIKGAMENKPIPKDALTAKQMIPRNPKLTDRQKKDRCSMCIIYNEHQRHKYKILMPMGILAPVVVYATMREPMKAAIGGLIVNADKAVNQATLGKAAMLQQTYVGAFQELVLACLLLIAIAYMCKFVEWLIFSYRI